MWRKSSEGSRAAVVSLLVFGFKKGPRLGMRTECLMIMESLCGVMKMFCSYTESWWLINIVYALNKTSST